MDIVFPPLCLHCGVYVESGETICDACFSAIPLHATLFCGACKARIPPAMSSRASEASAAISGRDCFAPTGLAMTPLPRRSVCHPSFPYLLGAATDYDDPRVKNLIHALKFNGVKRAAAPLARLLMQYAETADFISGYQVVTPIPLGKTRERTRGYNQAAEIARPFAEQFQLSFEYKCFVRTKNTKPQTEMDSSRKRAENVKDCFAVKDAEKIRGKRVVLIDDVTTSGATFLAAAEALKAAGARSVLALAAARA